MLSISTRGQEAHLSGHSRLVLLFGSWRHGHITAKMTHQEWPCTPLLNCNSLSTISMSFVVTEVQGFIWQGNHHAVLLLLPWTHQKKIDSQDSSVVSWWHGKYGKMKLTLCKIKGSSAHYFPHLKGGVWLVVSRLIQSQYSSHTVKAVFITQHRAWATGGHTAKAYFAMVIPAYNVLSSRVCSKILYCCSHISLLYAQLSIL